MSNDNLKKVFFVTSNKDKIDMFNKTISGGLLVESFMPGVDIVELESMDVLEVAKDKLNKALKYFPEDDVFLFVTDVGVFIEQLSGAPGGLIKRKTKELFNGNFHSWCSHLAFDKTRAAYIEVVIAAKNKSGDEIIISHKVQGSISKHPLLGPYGFAWDDIFIPAKELVDEEFIGKSFAQMPEEVKLKIFMEPPILELKRKILAK
ncbi:MAG: non-canonical purine NTP pyrophosphatase [Candidatus Woesearchaeota archaeon]